MLADWDRNKDTRSQKYGARVENTNGNPSQGDGIKISTTWPRRCAVRSYKRGGLIALPTTCQVRGAFRDYHSAVSPVSSMYFKSIISAVTILKLHFPFSVV